MEKLMQVGYLSIGGVLGVNARYWLGLWITRGTGPQFPWATFLINVSGSFMIGFAVAALARWAPHPHFRLLAVTGFLGGYTTYSTFALESLTLWRRGEPWTGAGYVLATVAFGALAVTAGALAGEALSRDRELDDTRPESVVAASAAKSNSEGSKPPSETRPGTDSDRGGDR